MRTCGRLLLIALPGLLVAACASQAPVKRSGAAPAAVPPVALVASPNATHRLDKLEAWLRRQLPAGVELERQDQNLWLRVPSGDTFATDAPALTAAGDAMLNIVAGGLNQSARQGLQIRVLTDTLGNRAANEKFAAERAEAVRAYLLGRGIASRRMLVLAGGPDCASGTGDSSEGRQLKRRLELLITPLFS